MIKYYLLFISLSFFSAFGQTNIGLSAGVGISNRSNDKDRNAYEAIVQNNSEIGTLLSVDINTSLKGRWFIASGIELKMLSFSEKIDVELWNKYTSDLEYNCIPGELPAEGIASVKHKFVFIQIPIIVNYVFAKCEECGWKWSVGVGPSFDISLNHKVKSPVFYKEDYIETECFVRQSVILGIKGEIGGQYSFNEKNNLGLSLFYDQQLQSLYDNPFNYNLGWFGLKVTYLFTVGQNK